LDTTIVDKNRSVSLGLWIPLIWYFMAATRGLSSWLGLHPAGAMDVDLLEGSPLDRSFYAILIAIGIFILIKRRMQWSEIIRDNAWILLIFLYMLLSILWSKYPELAFRRWVKTTGTLIMALLVLTEVNPLEAISTLLRRCFFVHLPLDIITVKYFRDFGVAWGNWVESEMWVGLTTHKNLLGQICMTSGLYFIWDMFRKIEIRRMLVNIFYLVLTIFLMNGPGYSRSMTSISVMILGISVLLLLQYLKKNPQGLGRLLIKSALAMVIVLLFLNFAIGAFHPGSSLSSVTLDETGKDATLTGRTELWTDILSIAAKNPLLGVGYGNFWIGDREYDLWIKHIWTPLQGHNGYIDVYVELGVIGIFLLIAVLVATFQNIGKSLLEDFDYGSLRLALFIMILVHNMAESSLLRSNHNLWFVFLMIAISIPATAREEAPAPLESGESIA